MDSLTSLQTLATVPKLEADGGNWPIFQRKFKVYMVSVGLDEHFLEDNIPAERYEMIEVKPIKEQDESDEDHQKHMDVWKDGEVKWKKNTRAWNKDDAKAISALGKVLPNSIYMEMSESMMFHEMWSAMETRIERITLHQKSNLKGRLNQMYCNEKDSIVTHLEEMESIYQQLASRNAKISDEDYVDAIIRSLPHSYSNLMTSLLTIFEQMNTPVTPAAIKNTIRKEHEARQTAASQRSKKPNEIALHADTRGRGRGRGRGGFRGRGGERGNQGSDNRDESRLTCFNCGGKGHKATACPSQKKPRGERPNERNRSEKREQETAAVAEEESDEAWMAMVLGTNALVNDIGMKERSPLTLKRLPS